MKEFRNKPNRDKRNRSRKDKSQEIREVPNHVWNQIKHLKSSDSFEK